MSEGFHKLDRALIVAAGRSTRLYPLTLEKPKCLLEVGGETIIRRCVRLLRQAGIGDVYVMTGFHRDQIIEHLGDGVLHLHNPFYAQCNNMGSLWMAHPVLRGKPFLYLHGDLVFHEDMIGKLLEGTAAPIRMLTDFAEVDEEAMKVRAGDDGFMVESSKQIPLSEAAGEWIGMTLLDAEGSARAFDRMDELLAAGELNAYDTLMFNSLAAEGMRISLPSTDGLPWREIDDQTDLEEARRMFAGD